MSNELNDFFNDDTNTDTKDMLDDFFTDSESTNEEENSDMNLFSDSTNVDDNEDMNLFGDSTNEEENSDMNLFGDSTNEEENSDMNLFSDSTTENEWGTEDSNNSWLDDNMENSSTEESLNKEPNEDGSVNWMTEPENSNTSNWSSDFDNSFDDDSSSSNWESNFDTDTKSSSDWTSDFANNHDDGWKSKSSNTSGWEDDSETSTSGWEDDFDTEFDNTTNNTNNSNDNTNETLKVLEQIKHKFNFSYKQVSLIIACGCLFIALLFLGISKIHISSNRNVNQQNLTKETNQVQQNSTGSQELRYIPPTTNVSYSEEVVTSSGKIKMKQKYLLGNQLVYDLVVEMKAGVENVNLHYYCTKDTFDTVYEGTNVTINYQVVDNNYYSIKNIIAN